MVNVMRQIPIQQEVAPTATNSHGRKHQLLMHIEELENENRALSSKFHNLVSDQSATQNQPIDFDVDDDP